MVDNMSATMLNGQAREFVIRLRDYFEREKENGGPLLPVSKVLDRVACALNIGRNTVSRIILEKYPTTGYEYYVQIATTNEKRSKKRKKRVENGKSTGLDPFSDNDDDVERLTRKFEQKYGGKSTYGRKGRTKTDDFADIGAGYDESDSFIDNTDGYDEMIPPECDTIHGGFYINCGSLEFKSVPENQLPSDADPSRRNKRRISSSSSEEESSDSSSGSERSGKEEDKGITNGAGTDHHTEHRKKKNNNNEKKKAKKVRRTDSSAATSGKQTSDDNGPGEGEGEGESADSRTSHSHSDSVASKRAPGSETAATSDSSRDAEAKVEVELPAAVMQTLEALEAAVTKHLQETPGTTGNELLSKTEQYAMRLERILTKCMSDGRVCRSAWGRAAKALCTSRTKLLQRIKSIPESAPAVVEPSTETPVNPTTIAQTTTASTTTMTSPAASHKRKQHEEPEEDFSHLTNEEREEQIVEALQRLKTLIDERKPGMIANYNAECERVQEERKKIQIASAAEGAPLVEKRLPKRRFPWCPRSRALLSRLKRLARDQESAALLLAKRALPLFPSGFVRMPTLLRQADLSKEIKVSDIKRQRLGSASQPPSGPAPAAVPQPTPSAALFPEPILFPSSLTVTTMKTSPDKFELNSEDKFKSTLFGSMLNSFNLGKDITLEKPEKKDTEKSKEELYVPPNNIGSITITPVLNQPKPEKKVSNDKGFIRVKSPAALNEMVKKDKQKKEKDKNLMKEKKVDTPLHIDTSYQTKDSGPKSSEIPQKQIENMRVAENNIPRPALVPVHHSPTFAKPDKRPPEVKKKKEIVIISDMDPLSDNFQEPLAIDDSSSDVEVVEEKSDKRDVPSKDKCQKKVTSVKSKSVKGAEQKGDAEESTHVDIDTVMRSIREMEHSQEPSNCNSNSYGSINSANHEKCSSHAYNRSIPFGATRSDKNKFVEPASLKKTDGYNSVDGSDTAKTNMIKS